MMKNFEKSAKTVTERKDCVELSYLTLLRERMRVASLSKTTVIPRERTKAVENLLDAKR